MLSSGIALYNRCLTHRGVDPSLNVREGLAGCGRSRDGGQSIGIPPGFAFMCGRSVRGVSFTVGQLPLEPYTGPQVALFHFFPPFLFLRWNKLSSNRMTCSKSSAQTDGRSGLGS